MSLKNKGKSFIIVGFIAILFGISVKNASVFIDIGEIFIIIGIVIRVIASVKDAVERPQYVQKRKMVEVVKVECPKCHNELNVANKKCPHCGYLLREDDEIMIPTDVTTGPFPYSKYLQLSEDKMLEEVVKHELDKVGVSFLTPLVSQESLKRKRIMSAIYILLLFIYISMIFFHFPLLTYVVGLIILIIFIVICNRYKLVQDLKKQIKARPSEKISNIVMNTKNTLTADTTRKIRIFGGIVAIILSLVIFRNPMIWYEKTEGGYAVRYYIFGLTNFKTAEIPATYKGENVVSLRGNTFSNMFYLNSVKLPDTITEIRGQAFKNCISLTEIELPKNLKYLGGGAFQDAINLKSIYLPDTLEYLGGEAFSNAISLESVHLSNNLTEIRGNTFEECHSLKSIIIPDSVVRIGGHAFYNDYNLTEVTISANSKLTEIGSSAFRKCDALASILIPSTTVVNEKAFKESPTAVYKYDINETGYDFSGAESLSGSHYDGATVGTTLYFTDYDVHVAFTAENENRDNVYVVIENEGEYVISILSFKYSSTTMTGINNIHMIISHDEDNNTYYISLSKLIDIK